MKLNKKSENIKKVNKNEESIKKGAFGFYKNNMFKKQVVIYIILMVTFLMVFMFSLNRYDPKVFLENVSSVVKISTIIKEFIFFMIFAIISGFVPILNLPVLSILYAPRLASYVCNLLFMRTYNKSSMTILCMLLLLALSFAITIGLNICKKITKKIMKK